MLLLPAVLGCSEYQKLSKGTDSEAKYAAAIDYYEDKDYFRALQLFEQLAPVYQGTIKAEKMQFYFAYCYYHQEDYTMASYYFKKFATTYPRSEFAEEAAFMNAHCYYLDSPGSSLDQTNTLTAISELQTFLQLFPRSVRREECARQIEELRSKLQKKDMDIANLYFNMEEYEAAIASYNNLLRDYPLTIYKEEALYRIMKSYFNYADNSIAVKKEERFQAALDAYNELIYQYPETVYSKEAKAIRSEILKRKPVNTES